MHAEFDLALMRTAAVVQVVVTNPVNEMSVQAAIPSPEMWVYGCTITPNYLK